jgi:putative ABC transport system ATP-binding protein
MVDGLRQTIVMVTHDPATAAAADRVLFLSDGRVVDQLDRPTTRAVADKLAYWEE